MARITSFVLAFLFLLFSLSGTAQDNVLYGSVTTSDSIPLRSAVVNIIIQKDSLFYSFARTDGEGKFSLKLPSDRGKYFLIASYPKFADVTIPFEVDSLSKGHYFGNIRLPSNAMLMEEVVVIAKRQLMNVKGDTLEYNLDRLKLEPNARVEDVLEQLPGMRVTRGGQIYSLGKIIEQVLVDGEPFFGNDPTLVTKNIRADIVDKIQVYDDASAKEKMTGIPDQNKRKTLDIKLKETKKTGMFGGVELGYLDRHYNNVLMLNKFNGKEKMFVYGLISNTGKIGLGYKTLSTSGGSIGDEFSSSTGKYTGEGLPKVYGAGLSYSNMWKDKYKLSTSISLNGINATGIRNTFRQINSGANSIGNTDNINFDRKTNNQSFQLRYEAERKSKFFIDVNAGASQNNSYSAKESKFFSSTTGEVTNNLRQNRQRKGNNRSAGFTANWSKSLGKENRVISIGLSPDVNASEDKISIFSINNNGDDKDTSSYVNTKNINGNRLVTSIDYTEPIFGGILALGYANSYYNNLNKTQAHSGAALQYDSMYSGDFRYKYISNKFTTSLQWKKEKITAVIGNILSLDKSILNDLRDIESFENHFVLLQPNANFKYEIRKNNSIRFNFGRTVTAPDLNLVLPLINNENVPYIYTGNKYLKPDDNNNISLEYHNFRIQKMRVYNASFNLGISRNAFGYNVLTNNEQIITSPINIPRTTLTYSLSTHFSSEVNTKKDYFMILAQGSKALNYNYVNTVENRLRSTFLKLQPSYAFFKRNGLQFNVIAGATYEQMEFSDNTNYNYNGFGFEGSSNISLFFPLKFSLKQSINLTYKPKFKLLNTSLNQFLWDITAQKQFGKESQFTVEFSINDLLNQNKGFQRYYSSTGFTENRYTTVQRYFLLSFKWDYNKMGEK